jgi:AraC-like DNA-binding protein
VRYRELEPSPRLAPWVRCYWLLEEDLQAPAEPVAERVFPDGCLEMVFHRGDPFAIGTEAGGFELQPRGLLFGQLRRFVLLVPPPRLQTIGVRFHPIGAHAFVREPLHTLNDRFWTLESLFGRDGSSFLDAVMTAQTAMSALELVERFLLARLDPRWSRDPLVDEGLSLIASTRGQIRVHQLVERLQTSARSLERRFRDRVGLGPKALATIARFQSVLRLDPLPGTMNLATVAQEAGFFDQAHFCREFSHFTGLSPTAFFHVPDDPLARLFLTA